ncbi:hypothetical protein HMPREF3034_00504 [Prevotella sp. DNF00663]|nr:hypothetical protein HMPREF3034_00504 [Prevotella sp. DNF00663]
MKRFFGNISMLFSDIVGLIRPLVYHLQYQHFRQIGCIQTQNKALAILGNGPSLRNFKPAMNIDVCTVNFSANTENFFLLKPKIYVMSDPEFFRGADREDVRMLWNNLQKVNWNLTLLLPYTFPKYFVEQMEANTFVKVKRFCEYFWEPQLDINKRLQKWWFKKGLLAPRTQNVMIPSLFNALLFGYKTIFLYGVEHSWLNLTFVDEHNVVMQKDTHYYGTKLRPWTHVDKDRTPMKLHEVLSMLQHTFESYWQIREFADYLGDVSIINKTPESFIDAFERG